MNDFEKMSAIAKANGRIWSSNLASNFIRANRHSKGWDITIGVGHDAGDLFSAGHIVGALYMVHVDEWKVNRADLVAEKDARIAFLEKALEQAVEFTGLHLLPEKEVEVRSDGFTGRITAINTLAEGLACSHQHLRGADDHPELAAYLREKAEVQS